MDRVKDMKNVIDRMLSNKYVVLKGGAGSGKSTILRELKSQAGDTAMFVSPTGAGSINIGGVTAHRAFSLPFGVVDKLTPMYKTQRAVLAAVELERIVIDECWMLRADMLDHIDTRLRQARNTPLPFGGLSVILVGDPYQLSPVITSSESNDFYAHYEGTFLFHSHVWNQVEWEKINLTEIKRQDNVEFVKALNVIRKCSEGVEDAIKFINDNCYGKPQQGVVLSPMNRNVDMYNKIEFDKIIAPVHTYKGSKLTFKGATPVDEVIHLKEGCRVVICAKDTGGEYVNGDSGSVEKCNGSSVVIKLDRTGENLTLPQFRFVQVEYKTVGKGVKAVETGSFLQIPIKLAHALSVHKSQGMTLESMTFDTGSYVFAPALVYVALSRARTLEGLTLVRPIKLKDVFISEDISDWSV